MTKKECETALSKLWDNTFGTDCITGEDLDKYVDVIDGLIQYVFNPQPYKFEDLKPNMVVFDRDFYGCGELLKIIETKTNEFGEQIIKAYEFGSMNINALRYKENRFFPVTKALEYQK